MVKAKSIRLGDIVNFKRGYDLPAYLREEGEFPVISSGGITGYHSEFKVEGEGVVPA
jgi:type I restriction enzyme S subunit